MLLGVVYYTMFCEVCTVLACVALLAALLYQQIRPVAALQIAAVVAENYPACEGPMFSDGLSTDATATDWDHDVIPARLARYIKAAEHSRRALAKIWPQLSEVVVAANETIAAEPRAVALARIVASAQPLLYPTSVADDVFEAWFWAMATIYHDDSAAAGVLPEFEPLPLVAVLQEIIDAELASGI